MGKRRGRRLTLPALLTAGLLGACLGDPVGVQSIDQVVVKRLTYAGDTLILGAPGRALSSSITILAADNSGRPLAGAKVTWSVSGTNAHLDEVEGVTGSDGRASANWTLGTNAHEAQTLDAEVATSGHSASTTIAAAAIPVEVAQLRVATETATVRLGVRDSLVVTAVDPFGNLFQPPGITYRSLDTGLVSVDLGGGFVAKRRGLGRLVASVSAVTETSFVHGFQVVHTIQPTSDSLHFHSLGQILSTGVTVLDDRGLVVADTAFSAAIVDTSVAQLVGASPVSVRSVANGSTAVRLAVGAVVDTMPIDVVQQAVRVTVTPGTVAFDALTDTVRATSAMFDSLNAPIAAGQVSYSSTAPSVAGVDAAGLITSKGNGAGFIVAKVPSGASDSAAISVTQIVTRVAAGADSLAFSSLRAAQVLTATAYDRLGTVVSNAPLQYSSLNSGVVTVTPAGVVIAVANGATAIIARSGTDSVVVPVSVKQRPQRVLVPTDTIRFVALGETQQVGGVAVDSLGSPVPGPVGNLTVVDTTIVKGIDSVTIRSRKNGATTLSFTVDSLPVTLSVFVQQVPDTVAVNVSAGPITLAALDSSIAMTCDVRDRNGESIIGASATVTSRNGTVANGACGANTAQHSGFDTLTVQSGSSASTLVPLVLAVRPMASSSTGDFLQVDSLPGAFPWAPTAFLNAQGGVDLYFAGYASAPSVPQNILGNLYRITSTDGVDFHYDTLIIPRDSAQCTLTGSGVENIAITPRPDGPGLRMFYSAGSFGCYGWQVFSAISTDGRTWTSEPGVRLSNGGSVPPQSPTTPPYPVGEGMIVDQLPSGQYRMIVGTFEHTTPPPNNLWQIAEWRSSDQLHWQYIGTVLTTRQMPAAGQGSVYSPTIAQVAPGLWRMIFTADHRGSPNSRSALWSAVSLDKETWQLEGQVAGNSSVDLYYATLAGSHLYFIRRDLGGSFRLASVTMQMP